MVLSKSCLILSSILHYTNKISPDITRVPYCIIKLEVVLSKSFINKLIIKILHITIEILPCINNIFSVTIKICLKLSKSKMVSSKPCLLLPKFNGAQ